MKFKILSLLLILNINVYADESFKKPFLMKIVDQLGQSTALSVFNYYLKKTVDATGYLDYSDKSNGSTDASSIFQELKSEAQEIFKIPQKYRLPLKKTNANVAAKASIESLYVNEKHVNGWPYGYKRCVMLHEIVHEKYHDPAMGVVVGSGSVYSAMSFGIKLAHYLPKKTKIICFILPPFSSLPAVKLHHYYGEWRADIEACYTSQCYVCVEEFSLSHGVSQKGGYLTRSQVKKISEELKRQNKICSFHKKQI